MSFATVTWGRSIGDSRPGSGVISEGWVHYDNSNNRLELYDGTNWNVLLTAAVYHGRATSAQTGWGASLAYTEWDDDIVIDTAYYTHSTTTDPELVQVDVAGRYLMITSIGFTSTGTGNGRFGFQKDTAGNGTFTTVASGQFYESIDTAGARVSTDHACVVSAAVDDQIRVVMLRYALGTFDTIANISTLTLVYLGPS